MPQLRLILEGPIASFSVTPRHQHRLSAPEPTKSAIAGMIACAMGLTSPVVVPEDFDLTVVSVSHDEAVLIDFQTIANAITIDGNSGRNGITYRYNFTNYRAIVDLEIDNDWVAEQISDALRHPVWPLYLGRRANVLSRPPLECNVSQ